jgi:hypothetical protein
MARINKVWSSKISNCYKNNVAVFKNIFYGGLIDEGILDLDQQIAVYNDTVGVFHFRDGQKVGMEIQNRAYAKTMRQMFESYWKIAKDLKN